MSTTKPQPKATITQSAQYWVGALLNDCEPDEKLDLIVKNAAAVFKVPIAVVTVLTPDSVIFKACFGQTRGSTLERDGSFCDVAVSMEPPLNIVDAIEDVRFRDYIIVTNELQIRSYFGKSLHAPDGVRIGTLCLLDTKPRKYTKLNQLVLAELAQSVEAELKNILRSPKRIALA